jgi:hypothetical protein
LKDVQEDWSWKKIQRLVTGQPEIVGLYTNLNRVMPEWVVKAIAIIRKDWPRQKKRIIVFRLDW